MIILRSDNRVLTANSEYSFLVDNTPSSSATVTVINTENFAVGNFICIEEFGKENAEIFRVKAINATTGVITLGDIDDNATSTKFAHAESTKIYFLPYNQIRFYWTDVTGTIDDEYPEFSTNDPLTGWLDLDPQNWFTSYSDGSHSTGFGWFIYRNSVTAESSQESNPIPYAGFDSNTVANVFAGFDSLMSNRDLKLVTVDEKFEWLNEALALVRNKLNLNSVEYFVSTPQTLTTVSGTAEYLLPADFADLVSITGTDNGFKQPLPYMSVNKVGSYNSALHGNNVPYYYIRNRYLGLVPTPTTVTTYQYQYRKKSTRVSGLSDYIDLPDDAYYALKDYMMYRVSLKFSNPIARTYLESFTNAINLYVQSAVKRDADLDSWEPHPQSIV